MECIFGQRSGCFVITGGLIAAILKNNVSILWPVMLWGSILLLLPLLSGYQFRRVYRKVPLLRALRNVDIDENKLYFTTASSDGRTTWEAYIRFAENERAFIFFQQGNQIFIPIPKRELNLSQIDELRSLFETHLPTK
ncbi:MAG TPA: YcxB family protein [Edaphobacter sp.]|nr:YcxB family protein [Edaphobacter sp.]